MQPSQAETTSEDTIGPSVSPTPQYEGPSKEAHSQVVGVKPRDKTMLKRALPGWQIFMIAIGGVIGITIFSTDGEIIHTAGPLGLLISFCFVSTTTICVMECIAELVILWPVSNAFVEFVKMFVDEELAIVVGIAYWYTMSSVFAVLVVVASDYASFWLTDETLRDILFYFVSPLSLLVINCMGVKTYGWVEGIGGILKIMLVIVGVFFMIVDAPRVGTQNIDAGFQHNKDEAQNNFVAICISIPILAYGFIGTEIVAVTAFEARDRKSLRFPVRWVAYIVSALYLASAILQVVVISWENCNLQDFNDNWPDCPGYTNSSSRHEPRSINTTYPDGTHFVNNTFSIQENMHGPGWISVMMLAAMNYGSPGMVWLFNASIIYFCLSAANTALYVASRTLFGLTRGINRMKPPNQPPWYLKPLRYLGTTTHQTSVPHFALIFSAIAFFWLPYLRLESNNTTMIMVMVTGSICGVFVWFTQCIAYIRYYRWFHQLKHLGFLPEEFNRWNPQPEKYDWHRHPTFLASLRLIPAWIGLVCCFLIIFVLSSAPFWNVHPVPFRSVATSYGGPFILLLIFVALKLWKRRRWVKLELSLEALFEVISYFEENSGIPLTEERSTVEEHTGGLGP